LEQVDKTASEPGRRGAKAYLAATAVAQLCALARYTILARFLGPEALGLVAMLTLASQFFQSITDNGSDRFLIQDKDGDKPVVQSLVQTLFVGRGAVQTLGLVLLAGPIAAYFKAPSLQPALMILGLAPLIFGFLHLDFRRSQRQGDFRAEATVTLVAEGLSLVATAVAAYLTRDFTAVLYGLITRSIAYAAVSHLLAKRRYTLGLSREHARRLAHFSVPLMFNGLLLFIGAQGDRVVVANELGLTQLGHYTAVLMLIFYPASTLMRYMGAMHLPRLAAAKESAEHRDQAADIIAGQAMILGLGMAAGFALVAPFAVVGFYGANFAQPPVIIALIGVFQAARFLRQWPTTIALSLGQSRIVLANNVVRMSGLACAFVAVKLFGGLASVTAGFIVGELLALITAITLVNRTSGRSVWHDLDRVALFIAVSVVIAGWSVLATAPTLASISVLAVGSLVVFAWFLWREQTTVHRALEAGLNILRKGRSSGPG
jgi:O-antigen/teichoic acid export membrane protein